MVGNTTASAVETALAVGRALSIRQSEGRGYDFIDRCHRRRAADGCRSRDWRAAAGRLLLRPDRPDMVGAAGGGYPRLWFDRSGGSDRTRRRATNGDTVVNPSRRRLGFILAAAGI